MLFHPDTLLTDPQSGPLARALYAEVGGLPYICPHGHTDPAWYANNDPFPDPATLLVTPDHYIFRMLVSRGVPMEALGVPRVDGGASETDPRAIWRLFAQHWHLFRGTPTQLWLDYTFQTLFGLDVVLSAENADLVYDTIADALARPSFRPRALYDRMGIEVIATTDAALDDLTHHSAIQNSDWPGRVIPTYRPDAVVDPDHADFSTALEQLGALTGEDTHKWDGMLAAHHARRAHFRTLGATATDHGHPTAQTANLDKADAAALLDRLLTGRTRADDAALFRAQMLTEMARMSVEDGMVMQIHPGSLRNHSDWVFTRFGRDKGFDIPQRTDYVRALQPMLDAVGFAPDLRIILFTLDETAYARELAPLAGAYPCLHLGPAWWFHDSVEGMRRYRQMTTETAGFWNGVGFNDDTRAFPSIPARHDIARRVDCGFLAGLVVEHRLREDEAFQMARLLTYDLPKRAYRLER